MRSRNSALAVGSGAGQAPAVKMRLGERRVRLRLVVNRKGFAGDPLVRSPRRGDREHELRRCQKLRSEARC